MADPPNLNSENIDMPTMPYRSTIFKVSEVAPGHSRVHALRVAIGVNLCDAPSWRLWLCAFFLGAL